MGIDVYYLAENTLYKLETEKNKSEKLIDMYIDNEQSLICKNWMMNIEHIILFLRILT